MVAPVLTPAEVGVTKTAARWRLAADGGYNPATAGTAAVTSTDAAWLQVFGITDFAPGVVNWTDQDDTDYDSVDDTGVVWASSITTGADWTISGTIKLADYGGDRDPGAAFLEDHADAHIQVHCLWFDRFGEKAYEGFGFVKWTIQGGAPTAISTAQFEIKGQGIRRGIVNPVAAATVPNAASVLPTTGPAGTTVVITGTNFVGVTGAAGVKFGATNAALYNVDSSTQITAVVPTGGAAGAQNILVTNGAGPDPTPVTFTKS